MGPLRFKTKTSITFHLDSAPDHLPWNALPPPRKQVGVVPISVNVLKFLSAVPSILGVALLMLVALGRSRD